MLFKANLASLEDLQPTLPAQEWIQHAFASLSWWSATTLTLQARSVVVSNVCPLPLFDPHPVHAGPYWLQVEANPLNFSKCQAVAASQVGFMA
jgi:hypothetical protein